MLLVCRQLEYIIFRNVSSHIPVFHIPAIIRALHDVTACTGKIQATNFQNALLNNTSNKLFELYFQIFFNNSFAVSKRTGSFDNLYFKFLYLTQIQISR
jgi:hypothetical protein